MFKLHDVIQDINREIYKQGEDLDVIEDKTTSALFEIKSGG